ncbi:hypothetical protein ACH4T9_17910 [Micromonospora sp. NPDC020750]|uniref:hypothetical protein n=1 Tax=unclassified Micromonospora TaxID=2617518 RepID=UPI0037A76A66
MNNFFGELAKQLAERWVGLLAVPGLLFVATAWAGLRLGWSHAVDLPLLASGATELGSTLGRAPGPAQALVAIGLLLAASGVGLTVQALAAPVRAWLLGLWPPGLHWARKRLAGARSSRWHRLVADRWKLQNGYPAASRTPAQQAEIDDAAARVNRLALAAPTRPTWMGDRIATVEQVALDRYGLDLRFGWSRLWLVLPDTVRADLGTANGQFAATVVTTAWALPYVVLGIVWWPALLIALAVGLTGWVRARAAVADLADLSEAVLDVHGRTLAVALGVAPLESTGPLSLSEGTEITRHVRKGR